VCEICRWRLSARRKVPQCKVDACTLHSYWEVLQTSVLWILIYHHSNGRGFLHRGKQIIRYRDLLNKDDDWTGATRIGV